MDGMTCNDASTVQRAAPIDTRGRPLPGGVLACLALCMLLPSLAISIANVALPTLSQVFHASFQQVQWIILAYLLATTTSVVSVGRLGDLAGRRPLLIAGIVVFTASSVLCSVAAELWMLIAARAAQGLGAAVMMALAMAFVGDAVPKEKAGIAMGLLGTMSAVGTALGPTLGGLLIETVGWRAIFFVSVPLGLATLGLARRHLPADLRSPPPTTGAGFDKIGTALLAVTLAAYALAMTIGRGDPGLANVALLAAAVLGARVFLWFEATTASPLIRSTMFRDRGLSESLAMSAIVSTVVMTTLVVGSFYLARALGLGTTMVGIVMSAGPVVAALTGVPAGRCVDRFGSERVAVGGLAGMVLGCLATSLVPAALGIAGYVIPVIVVTAGYALFQTANNTSVMANISPHQRGVISGMLTLSRNLGLITGASAMGAVFAFASRANDAMPPGREAVRLGMQVTFAVAAGLLVIALALALGAVARSHAARQAK